MVSEVVPPDFFISWFEENGRCFPWREEGVRPFQLLVTEMLLRQTRAMQVERIWNDFMRRFGTPKKLSQADREELFDRVKELGFGNQRVEALTSAARYVQKDCGGQVPGTEDELLEIPHIGPYSAHAVLCFAYGRSVPVVDTNILRLFCRLLGREVNRLDIRREPWAWEEARELLPVGGSAQAHNYGLLDFTASICKPRSPQCEDCQLAAHCTYGQKVKGGVDITSLP